MWTAKIIDKNLLSGKLNITIQFDSDSGCESFTESVSTTNVPDELWLENHISSRISTLDGLEAYSYNFDGNTTLKQEITKEALQAKIDLAQPIIGSIKEITSKQIWPEL